MAKKRVLFRRIESESDRKSNLHKKSSYLIKKLQELCILCGVIACVIIYSPEINEPIFWPPHPEIEETFARFESVPEIEKYQKSTTHESFMKENINKLEEQLTKNMKQIKRIEMNEMMYQIFTLGKRFNEFPIDKLIPLRNYIEEQLKSLDKRIVYLEKPAGIGGSGGSQQEQSTSQRVDEGEKIENIITNPIDYAGIENVASHWNQPSLYGGIVPFDGGRNIGSASGSYQRTIVSHGQESTINVSGTSTLGFYPESILGGSGSGGSMIIASGWGVGGGIQDASGFGASAPYSSGQETITGGNNINTNQSDDTFPFIKGWGLTGGYVSGGLHDVVLGQRHMGSGRTSGINEALVPPRAPGNQTGDEGVDRRETGGGTNEASGSRSNNQTMNE